jgi:hypothetical protein
MKKFKLALLALAVGIVVLFFFQNKPELVEPHAWKLNFFIPGLQYEYSSSYAMLLTGAFLIGLLAAYFSSLTARYKSNKAIKSLNAVVATQQEEIQVLKSELDRLKGSAPAVTPVEAEEVDPVTETRNPDAG